MALHGTAWHCTALHGTARLLRHPKTGPGLLSRTCSKQLQRPRARSLGEPPETESESGRRGLHGLDRNAQIASVCTVWIIMHKLHRNLTRTLPESVSCHLALTDFWTYFASFPWGPAWSDTKQSKNLTSVLPYLVLTNGWALQPLLLCLYTNTEWTRSPNPWDQCRHLQSDLTAFAHFCTVDQRGIWVWRRTLQLPCNFF